jgi:hypothetical protein
MREELVRIVANAPMLILDIVTNGLPQENTQKSALNLDFTTSMVGVDNGVVGS